MQARSWLRFCRLNGLALALVFMAGCAGHGPDALHTGDARPLFVPARDLLVCDGLKVSNKPKTVGLRRVKDFTPYGMTLGGITVLRNPAPGACLTSGFGPRWGRMHSGIDLQIIPAGPIVAAAAGTVIERAFNRGYGKYVLIDHGKGVYTRYAHLENYAPHTEAGSTVRMGQVLGLMGGTAKKRLPVHLHYEVLMGAYDTKKKGFGLTPFNPLGLAPAPSPYDVALAD
ncbi:MAG: M23 family metallopeptidase [Pseudomonadota bacterium]